jgi:hypothetical protein
VLEQWSNAGAINFSATYSGSPMYQFSFNNST